MAVVFEEGFFEGGFVAGLKRPEVALHQDGDTLEGVVEGRGAVAHAFAELFVPAVEHDRAPLEGLAEQRPSSGTVDACRDVAEERVDIDGVVTAHTRIEIIEYFRYSLHGFPLSVFRFLCVWGEGIFRPADGTHDKKSYCFIALSVSVVCFPFPVINQLKALNR